MIKVLLALLIGLARRRPVVEPGDRAPVAAEPGSDGARIQLVAIIGAGLLLLVVLEMCAGAG